MEHVGPTFWAKKVTEYIENFIKSLPSEEDIKKNYFASENLLALLNNIKRIKRELETDSFVIVICGGLKSGKSTLINLLCHREVSPTRLGTETTVRPCIFSSDKVSRVLLFYGRPKGRLHKKELFHSIVDYIKGIIGRDELTKELELRESSIAEAREWLTEESVAGKRNPLFVAIQIGNNELTGEYNLLKEGILLIDTPGLDGVTAGFGGMKREGEQDLDIDWLVERVDLMLLLQSTVSPINERSIEFIGYCYNRLNKPSIFLVHNKFYLKGWRKDKKIDELSEDDKLSIRETQKLLRETIKEDVQCLVVDLGMADDGINYNDKNLLKKSGFEDFEKELFNYIIRNRRRLHEDNIRKNIEKLKNENLLEGSLVKQDTLIYIKNIIRDRVQEISREKNKYLKLLSKIERFFDKERNRFIEDAITALVDNQFKPFLQNQSEILEKQHHATQEEYRVDEVCKEIQAIMKDYRKEIVARFCGFDGFIERFLKNSLEKIEGVNEDPFNLIEEFNKFDLRIMVLGTLPRFRIDLEKAIEQVLNAVSPGCWTLTEREVKDRKKFSFFRPRSWRGILEGRIVDELAREKKRALIDALLKNAPLELLKENILEAFDEYKRKVKDKMEEIEQHFDHWPEKDKIQNTAELLLTVEQFLRNL